MIKKVFPVFFVLGLALALFSLAYSQGVEVEPNNTCQTAQDLAGVTLPFPLDGNLEVLPGKGDVDFYRISGQPGLWVRVDLEGQATGQGTLQDPLLGAFDSYCGQIGVNDDFNGLNAHLEIKIPYEGVFTLAATSCCDNNFVGNSGVGGTYKLTIAQVPIIGSISGRAVDANTGDPLPGSLYPNAYAYLYRSDNDGKFAFVAYQQLDDLGRFQFTVDYDGAPLIVGTYRASLGANAYNGVDSEPFDVSEGENRELVDIALVPFPAIGLISGRLVDTVSGNPLPGNAPPYATVSLEDCYWEGYCYTITDATIDELGQFVFKAKVGNPIDPGTFRITAHADGYNDYTSAPFEVGDGQDIVLGDIALSPLPTISGMVVDAVSRNPLPGDSPPYVSVELQRCKEWWCWPIAYQGATSEGTFRLEGDPWSPLSPGSYQLKITANGYQENLVGPFDLAEGEQKNLGDILLTPLPPSASISGRIVDAKTGSSLPGDNPLYTYVELQRCYEWGCWAILSQATDSDGLFRFEGDLWSPLEPGSYRLRVTASSYHESIVGPFDLVENEQKDLGDIPLSPITFIGSIQGRVVDAINGGPIGMAYVGLVRCDYFQEGVCSGGPWMNSTSTDITGAFSFERDYNGNPLQSGFYIITVWVEQYYEGGYESFEVGENEYKDLGDLALTPYPVWFSDIQPCNDIPSNGGKCSYSVRVTNRQATALNGSAWSLVEASDLGSFFYNTTFQAGEESLRLDPEESAVVRFTFQVPSSMPDGNSICTEVFVGQGRFEGYFYPQGHEYLFCMYKGTDTFKVMSEEETSRLMRQKHQPAVVPSPK